MKQLLAAFALLACLSSLAQQGQPKKKNESPKELDVKKEVPKVVKVEKSKPQTVPESEVKKKTPAKFKHKPVPKVEVVKYKVVKDSTVPKD